MKNNHVVLNALLAAVLLAAFAVLPVSADDDTPPSPQDAIPQGYANDPELVFEAVNANGSINYEGMYDAGIVTQEADWMMSIPGSDGVATYHQYVTEEGSLVLVPTGLTTLGLQMNGGLTSDNMPDGYYNPIGILGTFMYSWAAENEGYQNVFLDGSVNTSGTYTSAGFSVVDGEAAVDSEGFQIVIDTLADYAGISADTYLAQLLLSSNGIWDLLVAGLQDNPGDFLALLTNLDSTILIYTNCEESPVGCTEEYMEMMAEVIPPSDVHIEPPQCPVPYTTTGPIIITGGPGAGDGGKLAPLHPVVVGQDAQRRGVDVQAWVQVPLVTYHYYEAVRHEELLCMSGPSNPANHGCPGPASKYANGSTWSWQAINSNKYYEQTNVYFDCVEHTQTFTDSISAVTISLSLTRESREWILTSLEQAYPGAHLKRPDFSFSFPGPGTLSAAGVTWTQILPNVQIEDPGYWVVTVNVLTMGTPVSGPRFATVGLGEFLDELVRVTLTSGD